MLTNGRNNDYESSIKDSIFNPMGLSMNTHLVPNFSSARDSARHVTHGNLPEVTGFSNIF